MVLKNIDKAQYRRRLNKTIIVFIVVFSSFSLLIGQLLIEIFGQVGGSNFKLNLVGVITGLLLSLFILSMIKHKSYMTEVYYVWQLKQLMNRIYRKLALYKKRAGDNDVDALIVLCYYYQLCLTVYQLDDNTLTIDKVRSDIDSINKKIESLNLSVNEKNFNLTLLD